jgi:hypothetical protein
MLLNYRKVDLFKQSTKECERINAICQTTSRNESFNRRPRIAAYTRIYPKEIEKSEPEEKDRESDDNDHQHESNRTRKEASQLITNLISF